MDSNKNEEVVSNDVGQSNTVSEVHESDEAEGSAAKKAKLDTDEKVPVKRTSTGGRKKKPNEDMLAEAKAICGDFDTSSGRSLRKRSEPPKVEEKKKPTPKKNTRQKKGKEKEAEIDDTDSKPEEDAKETKEEDAKKTEETKEDEKPMETNEVKEKPAEEEKKDVETKEVEKKSEEVEVAKEPTESQDADLKDTNKKSTEDDSSAKQTDEAKSE